MTAAVEEPASDALIAWVRENSRSIDDDDALLDVVGRSEVVAVGEPGHGAQEPLAFRNRLVRLLLAHDRIGAVALESGIVESRRLDHHVTSGVGDAAAIARDALSYGFGRLAANVDLLRLMRAHNEGRAQQVRLLGFDIPGADERGEVSRAAIAPRAVATVLRRTGGAEEIELADELEHFGAQLQRPLVRASGETQRTGVRRMLDRVDAHLVEQTRPRPRPRPGSDDDTAWAAVAARMSRAVFEMFCRWPGVPPGLARLPDDAIAPMLEASGWRDAAMADNVAWICSRVSGRTVLVFAANGHLIGDRHRGGLWQHHPDLGKPAGYHLRSRLRGGYRVLLTSSTVALPAFAGKTATAATTGIDRLLATTGLDRTVLDLREAPTDPWLDTVQSIGTNGPYPQAFVPRRGADALVHFARLTPAAQATP